MKANAALLMAALALSTAADTVAQDKTGELYKKVEAGQGFSLELPGSGQGVLYIAGPLGAMRENIKFGETTYISSGSLYGAGHYVLVAVGDTTKVVGELDVIPAQRPAELSFLAEPSRIAVGVHDGITGAVYLFDEYGNLVPTPVQVHFQLTQPSGGEQTRVVTTENGAAWTAMDSSGQQGAAKFAAQADGVVTTRIIRQVPGEPCGLKMEASQAGDKMRLATDPVRDCSGNAVPDGTIVTFTASYGGAQSIVDVPLKRGVAEVLMPSHNGATVSVASGVVLGNQIRWEK